MTARPTWLVTGAQGFLGANAGAFLAERAHRIGAVRTATAPSALFDEYASTDLEHPEHLADTIRQRRPDIVLHCAALAYHDRCEDDPDLARRVNVEASVALAQAAQDAGALFVLISTDAVFDGHRGHYREDDPTSPTSVYGRTKAEAEERVLTTTDALVVRTNFFGWSPSGSRSILEFFVTSLREGRQVRGFTDFTTSSAYAQVLVETLWDLAAMQARGIVHITSPDAMTKYDFGVAVAHAFALDPALITPIRADIHPPRNGDISLDVARAQALLGRPLPSMNDGILRAKSDEGALRRSLTAGPRA